MNNFYIFLDIDGTLYDLKFIKSMINKGHTQYRSHKLFNRDSINALNYLMRTASLKFNVELVISSTWRRNMDKTIHTLSDNGIILPANISATPITPTPQFRSKEIVSHLKDCNFNLNNDDYVIIDDESLDYGEYFDKRKIIKTDSTNQSLTLEMIIEYLSNNPNFSYDFEIEKE